MGLEVGAPFITAAICILSTGTGVCGHSSARVGKGAYTPIFQAELYSFRLMYNVYMFDNKGRISGTD